MGVELLSSAASPLSLTEAMGEFLQKFDGHPSIQSCFQSGEVHETLTTLIQYLHGRSGDLAADAPGILLALRCIKLLTRTRTELQLLLDESNLAVIIALVSHDATDLRDSIANEAIRVLINLCIIHQADALALLHRQRIHLRLIDLLDAVPAVVAASDLIFAISRLLFYVCLDDTVQHSLRHDRHGPRLLADKVVQYVASLDPGSVCLRTEAAAASCTSVSELLRVLFALCSNRDMLADDQELWQDLTAPLLQLLLQPGFEIAAMPHDELQRVPDTAYYLLMLDIIHLFFCFDERSLRRLLDKDVPRRVLMLLEVQSRYNCASVESALVPILTVLKSMCELDANVAHDAKQYVFGVEFASNKALKYEFENGDTTLSASSRITAAPPALPKILRQLITTFNPTVKEAVSQFLFTICARDPNEYIRVVGFGNAVGLLTQLNLPGYHMPSH